ncbi:MAG: hypothetical protein LBU10_03685 [Endomicrobium sp.]|jgi:DNA-binding beta-propeller fold protein YncE|nr:hypothetical protein [Endomicrobium sp.]
MVEVSKKLYVVDCIRTNNFSDNLVVQKIDNLWQKVSAKIPNGAKKYTTTIKAILREIIP